MPDNYSLPMKPDTVFRRLLTLLGSMNLAITLFLTLALASIIGTVLQQNQPYADYAIKFGPFWFDVFASLGLYDVYSALWFLAILLLLIISTTLCVIRHTPLMVRDMLNLRTDIQQRSLALMQYNQRWDAVGTIDANLANFKRVLSAQHFRVKSVTHSPDKVLIAAMRGGSNRLGYIATHVGVIVICLGGLLDSKLPLKLAEWQGKIAVETRDLAVSQIPDKSRLPVGRQAFRGSVNIPEGRSSNVAFVPMRDGYLVQDLPFRIEVKDFRVAHYASGQPKSFATDLLLYDDALAEPLFRTISVNKPLLYKGYAIYQASFSDGGSGLTIDIVPLKNVADSEVSTLKTKVFSQRNMRLDDQPFTLEMNAFRLFNINPDPTEDDLNRIRNFGPSIGFKLRKQTGEAKEYMNYMLPVLRDGRNYYLSGVRASPAEAFAYLYLPLDADDSLAGFRHFLMRLNNKALVDTVARQMTEERLATIEGQDVLLVKTLQQSLAALVNMFVQGGFDDVHTFIEKVLPDSERDRLSKVYLAMLHDMLTRIYFSDLAESLVDYDRDQQFLFLQDAVDAVGSLPRYGSPVYLLTTDYDHVEASGLQITRAPGKPVVYLGCALLIIGIFLLFYVPQIRLWLLLSVHDATTTILLAGMSNRRTDDFAQFFANITADLKQESRNA